jgi:hypothetical protein
MAAVDDGVGHSSFHDADVLKQTPVARCGVSEAVVNLAA